MENGEASVFLIIRKLFQLYLEAEGLTVADAPQVGPEKFMIWVKDLAEVGLGPFEDGGMDLVEELDVDEDSLEAVVAMSANPMGFLQLMPIWHAVVLSQRPDPDHPLESFQLLCILKWRDGRATPLAVFAPGFLSSDGFTDATVSGLLLTQSQELMRHIISDGLDGLHNSKSEQYGGPEVFREFVAMMQSGIAELPLDKRKPCLNYLRLFQSIISPPIPHELQVQIKEMASKVRQTAESELADELFGGWDG